MGLTLIHPVTDAGQDAGDVARGVRGSRCALLTRETLRAVDAGDAARSGRVSGDRNSLARSDSERRALRARRPHGPAGAAPMPGKRSGRGLGRVASASLFQLRRFLLRACEPCHGPPVPTGATLLQHTVGGSS